jgi:hypothetical protein
VTKKLIVFTHHKPDDFTRWSFRNAAAFNLGWDIVPMGFAGYDLMEGSAFAQKSDYPSNKILSLRATPTGETLNAEDWFDPDFFLYEAVRQFPEYDEYFLYEYDTICNDSIESFFKTDVDFSCCSYSANNPLPISNFWVKRYRMINKLGWSINDIFSAGQMTCIYAKRHILESCREEILSNKELYYNMLSEIRLGTVVRKFTDLVKHRDDIGNFITWKPFKLDLNRKYYYHPVKNVLQYAFNR